MGHRTEETFVNVSTLMMSLCVFIFCATVLKLLLFVFCQMIHCLCLFCVYNPQYCTIVIVLVVSCNYNSKVIVTLCS